MAEKKKSLKPIPSTLRGKKRYVLFSLVCAEGKTFSEKEVFHAIWNSFSSVFGSHGLAEQKLWLLKWFPSERKGIVRCSLPELEKVVAGLLFVQQVQGVKVVPLVLSVSGSAKKLKGKVFRAV